MVVLTQEQVVRNIVLLHAAVESGDRYARELIKLGVNFVALEDGKGEWYFGPSRFVGYENNTLARHFANQTKDGKFTDPAIAKLFKGSPEVGGYEKKFLQYCARWNIRPRRSTDAKPRRFWPKIVKRGGLDVSTVEGVGPLKQPKDCSSPGPSAYERHVSDAKGTSLGLHLAMHGKILDACEAEGWTVVRVETDEVALPDLAVQKGSTVILFEVKSSGRLADIYTGVGQLLLYRKWLFADRKSVRLVLALPDERALRPEHRTGSLKALGIECISGGVSAIARATRELLSAR